MSIVRFTLPRLLALLVGVAVVLGGVIAWMNVRGEDVDAPDTGPYVATAEQIARGAYLARAGNCAACHTDRGGAPYAGG